MTKINKVKKILLIDPDGFGSGLNLGLGYLAATLLQKKFEVRVIDCNNVPGRLTEGFKLRLRNPTRENWRLKINKALRWRPEVIGISINSFSLDSAIEIINFCQQKKVGRSLYIAGGPHVTMVKADFMAKYKDIFDYAVFGEGEKTFVDLLNHLDNPREVRGMIYFDKKSKQVVQTEARALIDNLDSLPFPNFEVFDTVSPQRGLHNYQMISSRGCPYKCVFCFHLWTNRWRARSPENILAEIKFATKKYKIKTITFWDDNFSLDINRAKKICDLLIVAKLNKKYYLAGIRADRIDEEMIRKLKESGCIGISMGIEDGDARTAPLVGKGESLSDIKRAVKLIQKYKIPLLTYMVTGLINSSYKSFLRSLRFVEDLGVNAHWSIAFPFPNTPLFDWAQKKGRFLMTLEEGFRYSMTNKNPPVVFDTTIYPREERLRAYYLGNLRCKSYDMLVSSRRANFFSQSFDIFEAIWKYDRANLGKHILNIARVFSGSIL